MAPSSSVVLDDHVLASAMRRAIDLARRGPTDTSNPQVGCVIVNAEGRIVAEGWHRGSGTPHAEIDALEQLSSDWLARAGELSAVVTLEPCNHTGKTGPCAMRLAEMGIGSVVWALNDPNPRAAGGSATLQSAGVATRGGVLANEAGEMLNWWLRRFQGSDGAGKKQTRPDEVIVKWAQSLDGRAAAADGTSQWITGPEARADVHRRRAEADAILVGTGTVLADDPALTARNDSGDLLVPPRLQPMPVVIGNREIPEAAQVWRHPALAANGYSAPLHYRNQSLRDMIADLRRAGFHRLFVEGGPTLQNALLGAGLVDRVLIYFAPTLLGGPGLAIRDIGVATLAERVDLTQVRATWLGDDTLIEGEVGKRRSG